MKNPLSVFPVAVLRISAALSLSALVAVVALSAPAFAEDESSDSNRTPRHEKRQERRAQWKENNPKKAEHLENKKENRAERRQQWAENNPEKAERREKWKNATPEERQQWRKDNPEAHAKMKERREQRRANFKKGAQGPRKHANKHRPQQQ